MDRMISYLVTILVAIGLGLGYDRRPHIAFTLPIPLWHPTVAFPDGLKVQRDTAWAAIAQVQTNLNRCQGNTARLQDAVAAQNKAVDGLKAQSDAWVAKSANRAQTALSEARSKLSVAAQIMSERPATADLCQAADRLILEHAQ